MTGKPAITVIQTLPALDAGGVERGTVEIARALVEAGHRSIVVSAGGRLESVLADEGSEHISLDIGRKSLSTLRHVRRLRRIFETSDASIVHTRSRMPAWITWLAWRGMDPSCRPGLVTSVHGPYSVNRYSRIMVMGERVIAISDFIRDYIIKNYPDIDTDRITIIPRGVSTEQFPYDYNPTQQWIDLWRQQFPETVGKKLVTLPARITRWKGQEDFLSIMSQLRDVPDLHGIIAGGPHPGKERFFRHLQSAVIEQGLEDRISFTGHRQDIREIMSISSVVLSLSNKPEAFGRTVLESLALGRPVIAYDHGGAAEVMQRLCPDGRIKPGDLSAAANKIKMFIDRPVIIPADNPFTLERMQRDTLDLYHALSARANGAG